MAGPPYTRVVIKKEEGQAVQPAPAPAPAQPAPLSVIDYFRERNRSLKRIVVNQRMNLNQVKLYHPYVSAFTMAILKRCDLDFMNFRHRRSIGATEVIDGAHIVITNSGVIDDVATIRAAMDADALKGDDLCFYLAANAMEEEINDELAPAIMHYIREERGPVGTWVYLVRMMEKKGFVTLRRLVPSNYMYGDGIIECIQYGWIRLFRWLLEHSPGFSYHPVHYLSHILNHCDDRSAFLDVIWEKSIRRRLFKWQYFENRAYFPRTEMENFKREFTNIARNSSLHRCLKLVVYKLCKLYTVDGKNGVFSRDDLLSNDRSLLRSYDCYHKLAHRCKMTRTLFEKIVLRDCDPMEVGRQPETSRNDSIERMDCKEELQRVPMVVDWHDDASQEQVARWKNRTFKESAREMSFWINYANEFM